MNQKQFSKEPELANCDISRSRGLKTFNAADTDSDMSGLNHGHIIGAVTNGQEESLLVALDKLDDQGLLKGRHTTINMLEQKNKTSKVRWYLPANNGFANDSQIQEQLLHIFLQSKSQRPAVNYQSQRFGVPSGNLALNGIHFLLQAVMSGF